MAVRPDRSRAKTLLRAHVTPKAVEDPTVVGRHQPQHRAPLVQKIQRRRWPRDEEEEDKADFTSGIKAEYSAAPSSRQFQNLFIFIFATVSRGPLDAINVMTQKHASEQTWLPHQRQRPFQPFMSLAQPQ